MFKKTFSINNNEKKPKKKSIKDEDNIDELLEMSEKELDEKYGSMDKKDLLKEKDRVLGKLTRYIDDETADSGKKTIQEIFDAIGLPYNEIGLKYFIEGYQFALATTRFDQKLGNEGYRDEQVAYKMCAVIYKLLQDLKDEQ